MLGFFPLSCLLLVFLALGAGGKGHNGILRSQISSLGDLREKVQSESLPLFDFGRELDRLLSHEVEDVRSELQREDALFFLEGEVLFNEYMDGLRDHYLRSFTKELDDLDLESISVSRIHQRRDHFIKECRIAMLAGKPMRTQCSSWSIEGPLAELSADTSMLLREKISSYSRSDDSFGNSVTHHTKRKAVMKKTKRWIRWFASQSILLLVNFLQNEWQRRAAKAAAEKRLADVPEFPLL